MTKWTIFDKNWKIEKNALASQKMTKLSIFDKIEEAKKYTSLSQNDKMGYFWQFWKSEKTTRPSQKMTKLSIFDKIVWYITTPSVYIVFFYTYLIIWSPRFKNDKMDHFWQKMKNWKNALASQKMTKLSIFDKTEEVKKIHGSLRKWQIEHFWQNSLIYHNTYCTHRIFILIS